MLPILAVIATLFGAPLLLQDDQSGWFESTDVCTVMNDSFDSGIAYRYDPATRSCVAVEPSAQ